MRIVLPIGRAVFTSIATLALNSALQAHEDSESGGLLHDEYSLGTTFSAPGVPGKWGPAVLGTGATVTWSIIDGGVSLNGASYNGGSTYNGNSVGLGSFMTTFDYLGQIQAAFNAWSAVANITFQYVLDSGSAFNVFDSTTKPEPNIRIGAFPMGVSSSTLAVGYYPPNYTLPQKFLTGAGDIHLNSSKQWQIGYAGDGAFDLFQVISHEIGHAIGLGHSATSGALMYAFYSESFSGPQTDDANGARYLYGELGLTQVAAVPEGGTWFAGLLITVGGLRLWHSRRR